MMLEKLVIKNLTVFPRADLSFARNLNIIVGENGAGKTHLLKIAYAVLAVSAEQRKTEAPASERVLQVRLADKLVNVFRPEQLGRLVRRKPGQARCDISAEFEDHRMDVSFSFATKSQAEVKVEKMPTIWSEESPAYLPTRELLTIYPNFVSVYENHYLDFEETWRDTCILLGALLQRGPKEKQIRSLLKPLEDAMGGESNSTRMDDSI